MKRNPTAKAVSDTEELFFLESTPQLTISSDFLSLNRTRILVVLDQRSSPHRSRLHLPLTKGNGSKRKNGARMWRTTRKAKTVMTTISSRGAKHGHQWLHPKEHRLKMAQCGTMMILRTISIWTSHFALYSNFCDVRFSSLLEIA